jgi:hypothetical protein
MLEEAQVETPVEDAEIEQPIEPPSIRDSLASALEESKAKAANDADGKKLVSFKATPKEAKVKDDNAIDKPLKTKTIKDITKDVSQVTGKETVLPEIKTPQSFQGANAPAWKDLPRNMQEFLAKREEDYHRELTKQDEERTFGRSIKELASPYLPLIQAEGGDVTKAFQNFLNHAYILRTKSPQEKGLLILKLAQEFGADLRGAAQQGNVQVSPQLQQLQQEVQDLKKQREQEIALKKQQEDTALKSQVDAFSADPTHIYFETVKAEMAALLRGGIAKDLQDAYDRAVHANPQTRSALLSQQKEEEKQVADKKAKAEAAKRAGSSLRGGPGPSALKNGQIKQPDLRKALESAFAEHRGEA